MARASEVIANLQGLIDEFGDLEVLYETAVSTFSPSFEFEAGFSLEDSDGASVFLLNLAETDPER
jgi:hypothetical protein